MYDTRHPVYRCRVLYLSAPRALIAKVLLISYSCALSPPELALATVPHPAVRMSVTLPLSAPPYSESGCRPASYV
ncbi:hypothetical protein LX36DRAFT_654412, partial [Colletotrichum falcatum]